MNKTIKRILCAALLTIFVITAAAAEDSSNVNRWLSALGYLDNAADASPEAVSQALVNFQKANGLKETGEADADTLTVLLSENAVSKRDYIASAGTEYQDKKLPAYGSTGDAVRMMQSALQDLGYFSGNCDGAFGAATEAAVRRFQLANGLTISGEVDETFCMRLYDDNIQPLDYFIDILPAAPGDERETVRMLQLWLRDLGLFTGECTGRYGRFTAAAVTNFQALEEIEQTGIVDRATAAALFNAAADAQIAAFETDISHISERLNELGCSAHETMDLQTELALMRFCKANALTVSTSLTPEILDRLDSDTAEGYAEAQTAAEADDATRMLISADAQALLGHTADFDTSYELVRYAYLKNGIDLPDVQKLIGEPLEDAALCRAGDIIMVQVGSAQVYGVATEDHAVVFCANNGYIVMRYLSDINADMLCVCRAPSEEA